MLQRTFCRSIAVRPTLPLHRAVISRGIPGLAKFPAATGGSTTSTSSAATPDDDEMLYGGEDADALEELVPLTRSSASPTVQSQASQGHTVQPASTTAKAPPSSTGAAAEDSTEAYRFLLSHIDAEIAALQRRHSAVTERRHKAENTQTVRIKELFSFIESPWSLMTHLTDPPLPATGVDVYIKEQKLKRGDGEGGKMYVLACHKNYRNLPAAQKKWYETAAAHNTALRQELKHRLSTGCARFEALCEQLQECTAEMARQGRVPELPQTVSKYGRFGYPRPPGSKRKKDAKAAAEQEQEQEGSNVDDEEEEIEDASGKAQHRRTTIKRKEMKAKQHKAAHATVTHVLEAKAAARVKRVAKAIKDAKHAASAVAPRHHTKNSKRSHVGKKGGGTAKTGPSASIPLPDIEAVARNKLRKALGAIAMVKAAKKPAKARAAPPRPRKAAPAATAAKTKKAARAPMKKVAKNAAKNLPGKKKR